MGELALTRDHTLSRILPAVGAVNQGCFIPALPDLMALARGHCEFMKSGNRSYADIAEQFGLSEGLVYKAMHDRIKYSAPFVREVQGVDTQVVTLVVPVHPDDPPLPDLLALDVRLVPVEGGWQVGAPGYTLQTVAEMAGCSLRTVQRRVRDGTLPIVELVEGRPKSHRLARVPEGQALRAWMSEYRTRHGKEATA